MPPGEAGGPGVVWGEVLTALAGWRFREGVVCGWQMIKEKGERTLPSTLNL